MSVHVKPRPRTGNADSVFARDQEPIARTVERRPVRYLGGLYDRRRGTLACIVAERRDHVPAPLVLQWADGTRGIAERGEVEVLR